MTKALLDDDPRLLPGDKLDWSVKKSKDFVSSRKKALFVLAVLQTIFGSVLLITGSTCVLLDAGDGPIYEHTYAYCPSGECIWVSVIALLTGLLGMLAVTRKKSRSCLAAYLVLCLAVVALGVYMLLSSANAIRYAKEPAYGYVTVTPPPENHTRTDIYEFEGQHEMHVTQFTPYGRAQLGLNVVISVIDAMNLLCCCISASLIFAIWSKTAAKSHSPSIVFVQQDQMAVDRHQAYVPTTLPPGFQDKYKITYDDEDDVF